MNAIEILQLIKQQGFNEHLQTRVVELGDPELAYRFALDLREADLDLLESVIVRCNTPRIVYEFALIKAERGGSVEALQDLIINSGDGGLMILFAIDVEGADMERFEDAIRGLRDTKYINLLEAEKRLKGYY